MYSPIIPPNKPPLKMGSIMSKFWIGGREQLSSSLWVTKMVSDRAAISSQVVLFPKSIPLTTISQLLERLEDTESEVTVLEVCSMTIQALCFRNPAANYLLPDSPVSLCPLW